MSSDNPYMRAYYIKYYKILSRVIEEAKRQQNCRFIAKSNNQIKTTSNIIKQEIGKLHLAEHIPSLIINDENVEDPEEINVAMVLFDVVFCP
jgi:hypothetical protein